VTYPKQLSEERLTILRPTLTYPKQLSEERLTILRPTLAALEILPEGEHILIKDSPPSLDRIRGDIYVWLHNKSLKPLYRLCRLSPGVLVAQRLVAGSPCVTSSVIDSPGEAFCRDFLLEVDNENEADQLILVAIAKKELTSRDASVAMSEWKRIQGL